jgi:hypothetical protein
MRSFLRTSARIDVPEHVDANRALLREFAALDPDRQNEAADHVAVLWHCFVDQFGSPAEFHREPRTKQDAYIAKFERVAARTDEVKHQENGHLHYSVALILHFLLIARDGARQQSALDLSGRVASLINSARDRQLAARRSHLVDALSTSLFDSSADAITDVIVDRPMDFYDASDITASEADDSHLSQTGDTSHAPRHRAVYKREGERWVKRPRFASARRAG